MSDYLGDFQQVGVTYIAYSPNSRRFAYDVDGTIVLDTLNNVTKKFTNAELTLLNSEQLEYPVAGAITTTVNSLTTYRNGKVTFIFPEIRVINGAWMSATPQDSGNVGQYVYPDKISIGYLHDPYPDLSGNPKIFPRAQISLDAEYNYQNGSITGTWEDVNVDFYNSTFHGEKLSGSYPPYTVLSNGVPGYTIDLKLFGEQPCKGLTLPYMANGFSPKVNFSGIHLYGKIYDASSRLLAFTDGLGNEIPKDVSFGQMERGDEAYYSSGTLQNQSNPLYVKNVDPIKTLKAVTLTVDQLDTSNITQYYSLSLDAVTWRTVLEFGDLVPGQEVGPIWVRLKLDNNAALSLQTTRLKLAAVEAV